MAFGSRLGFLVINSLMGIAAKSSVLTGAKAPPKFPIGVRIASTMNASFNCKGLRIKDYLLNDLLLFF